MKKRAARKSLKIDALAPIFGKGELILWKVGSDPKKGR